MTTQAVTAGPAQAPAPRSVPAQGRSRLRRAISLGIARGRLEVLMFFRGTETVVFSVAFPAFALVILSAMFSGPLPLDDKVTYSEYLVPGVIGIGLMVTGFQTLAISIAIERDRGALKRLAATPMPRSSYFIGKVFMVVVTSVVETALLIAVSVVFYGAHLPRNAGAWLTLTWVSLLGMAASALCGIALSSLPRNSRSAPTVVAPFAFVLQFISGAAIVFTSLPGWLQFVGELFPLKWMCQGLRSVFLPDSYAQHEAGGGWQLGWVAVVLGVWVVIGLVLCALTFRWTKSRGDG
nr:ABC transporter permease [Catenulispora sp.]